MLRIIGLSCALLLLSASAFASPTLQGETVDETPATGTVDFENSAPLNFPWLWAQSTMGTLSPIVTLVGGILAVAPHGRPGVRIGGMVTFGVGAVSHFISALISVIYIPQLFKTI